MLSGVLTHQLPAGPSQGWGGDLAPKAAIGSSSLEEGAVPSTVCPGKDSHPRKEYRKLELAEDQWRLSFPKPADHMLGCSHLS